MIHNAGRNACKFLSFDVEKIKKIFAEFPNSSKAVEILKSCFEDLDMIYKDVLRHVITRWLTLFPAAERTMKNWPAIKKCFIKQGELVTDKTI